MEDVKHAEMEGLTLSSVEDIWKLRFQIFQATLAAAAGGASLSLQSGFFQLPAFIYLPFVECIWFW